MKTRFLCLVTGLVSVAVRAQDVYSLGWATVDGGGRSTSQTGALVLAGATIGQPDAAPLPSRPAAAFAFQGGVWQAAAGGGSSVIASDDFEYAAGPASDNDGGEGVWESRWIGFGFRIEEEALNGASTMPANFNRLRRAFTNDGVRPELFVSFDLTTPAVIGLNDFAACTLYTIEFSNPPSLVFGKAQGSNELVLGNSNATTGIVLQPLTTYHLVGLYDVDQRQWALWVDPDSSDSYTPTTGQGTQDATLPVNSAPLAAYQIMFESSKPGYLFDTLVLSHSPGGVGLAARSVPPPSADALDPVVRLDNAQIVLSWKDLGVPVIVEESADLLDWAPVANQPTGDSYRLPVVPGGKYLRLSLRPR